ncbi:MAG: nitroreductase family protein [Desulfobulbus sp.]
MEQTPFAIDQERCILCGACADDCPYRIIEMADHGPVLNPTRIHHCIQCQHCIAVCPTGALSIWNIDPDKSLPLPESFPTADQVAALIRGRRSVRRYLPEPLEPEVIDRLLRTVANAPTGKNNRSCLLTVIEDRATMAILREETMAGLREVVRAGRLADGLGYFRHVLSAWDQGKDIIFRDAPHLLMVSAPPESTTPEADALIAMTCFELMAASMGIGVLWNAMIRWVFSMLNTNMYARLGIPDDHYKGYALLFGRPAVRYHRTVQRDEAHINRVRLS